MLARRHPGDHVILRDVYGSRTRAVVPHVVVEDNDVRVALLLKVGTPFCLPADRYGRVSKDVADFDRLVQLEWSGFEQLLIAPTGARHAVIARWDHDPGHRLVEWYVNLQAPLVRTDLGFDTTDHALDVVISADLQHARWKDEDQLADLVRTGYFSEAESAEFYREGEFAIGNARTASGPFGEGWERWRPDPGWRTPSLPVGWQELCRVVETSGPRSAAELGS